MKVSICIPTYEMHGKGTRFLEELFQSITSQTYQHIEIILSDHSQADEIETCAQKWSNRFSITYKRCDVKRGNSSANMNNAIAHATGDLIKIMHQDDLFHDPLCLSQIVYALDENPDVLWGVCSLVCTTEDRKRYFRYQHPYMNAHLSIGRNSFGPPSILFFRREVQEPFDEELIWINDSEYYYRLITRYGNPLILESPSIAIRQWGQQVSHTLATDQQRQEEFAYVQKKHHLPDDAAVLREEPPEQHRPISTFKKIGYHLKGLLSREDDLTRIANRFHSDKGTRRLYSWESPRHCYTPIYHRYFKSLRNQPLNILEIGIAFGHSLKMWYTYFPHAQITAFDANDYTHFNNDRVQCLVANQSDREQMHQTLKQLSRTYDIIIDDGEFYMKQQQMTLGILFPYLKSGGLYCSEDLHTSHWPYTEYPTLFNNITIDINANRSNTTLKMILDYITCRQIRSEFLLEDEMNYLNSMIKECTLFDTGLNDYGPNHLAIFRKR